MPANRARDRMSFAISPDERRALAVIAESEGRTASAEVRHLVRRRIVEAALQRDEGEAAGTVTSPRLAGSFGEPTHEP